MWKYLAIVLTTDLIITLLLTKNPLTFGRWNWKNAKIFSGFGLYGYISNQSLISHWCWSNTRQNLLTADEKSLRSEVMCLGVLGNGVKTLGPGWARGEQMLACGSCPILPGEGRSVERGVSRTAPRVITLIDTSPHTYTPPPRGPIRRLPLRAGDRPDTGAACLCITAVIAAVIFVCVCFSHRHTFSEAH